LFVTTRRSYANERPDNLGGGGWGEKKPAKLARLCKVGIATGRLIHTVGWSIPHFGIESVWINPANECVCVAHK